MLVSLKFPVISMLVLLIIQLYLLSKSIAFNIFAISIAVLSTFSIANSPPFSLFFSVAIITSFITIIFVLHILFC